MSLLIIDGDVLCYHCCRNRWEKKVQIDDAGVAHVQLGSDGKRIPFEYTKEDDRQYLEESWTNFQRMLVDLNEKLFATDYLMVVKGPNNFRYNLYPEYKLNRHADPTQENKFVPIIRQLAVKEDLAIEAVDRESDDVIRIWAEEAIAAGDSYVICSIDKDLKCIPGRYYDMTKGTIEEITPEKAKSFYYQQLLKGDPTDNIPGIPRVGDVRAARLVANCKTDEEYQDVVIEQYMMAYDKDWRDFLLSNAKMIHLQRHLNDYFSFDEWPLVRKCT